MNKNNIKKTILGTIAVLKSDVDFFSDDIKSQIDVVENSINEYSSKKDTKEEHKNLATSLRIERLDIINDSNILITSISIFLLKKYGNDVRKIYFDQNNKSDIIKNVSEIDKFLKKIINIIEIMERDELESFKTEIKNMLVRTENYLKKEITVNASSKSKNSDLNVIYDKVISEFNYLKALIKTLAMKNKKIILKKYFSVSQSKSSKKPESSDKTEKK